VFDILFCQRKVLVIFKTIQTVKDFGYIAFIQEASSAILEKHLDKLSDIRLELVVLLSSA
jgi:hypothetical protein